MLSLFSPDYMSGTGELNICYRATISITEILVGDCLDEKI